MNKHLEKCCYALGYSFAVLAGSIVNFKTADSGLTLPNNRLGDTLTEVDANGDDILTRYHNTLGYRTKKPGIQNNLQ